MYSDSQKYCGSKKQCKIVHGDGGTVREGHFYDGILEKSQKSDILLFLTPNRGVGGSGVPKRLNSLNI